MKADRIQSKHNDFLHVTDWKHPGGVWPFGLRINCSSCTGAETLPIPRGLSYTCPQEMADTLFRNKGWRIGRNRKNDICPACKTKTKRERADLRNVPAGAKLADVMPPSIAALATASGTAQPKEEAMPETIVVRADAPRQMGREEKRLIFSKLHEVYLDEERGYIHEWTDKRVATDLGVPLAWVANVREADFGPERSNENTRKHVEEARALLIEAQAQRDALVEIATNAVKTAEALGPKIEKLAKALGSLEKAYR